MSQMPEAKPAQGGAMVRGMVQKPRQVTSPALGAQDVLLDYLRQNPDDNAFRERLMALIQEPAWEEGERQRNISDGYAPGYQGMEYDTIGGRQRLIDVLSRYADTPATQQFPSIWRRR